MPNRIGIRAVIVGASIIVVWTAFLIRTSIETHHGPVPGQGLATVVLIPPCLLLIAWGAINGVKQLPARGHWRRSLDIAILSCGCAVGASVVLWVLYTGIPR